MTITFLLQNRSQKKPDWSEAEDAKVARLRKGGLSSREIAGHFENRSHAALKNRVWKLQQQGVC